MTLWRTTAGINKAEDAGRAGRMDAQIGSADALRRIFPTALASYLQFRDWIRQETLLDRSSVTFDVRQCAAPKSEARKPANPNAARTPARKASKPATSAAKPKVSKKPKRVRLTVEQRQERARARAAENRRNLKDSGLCKDCRQPAVPGQVRCSSCADKHRKSWKPRTSKGKDQDNMMN